MTQYVQAKVETLEHPITVWVLSALIGIMAIAYALFINATITNIVATKTNQGAVSALTSNVSALESRYLAAKSAITMNDALAMGFSQPTYDTVYISRTAADSLSFNAR